MINELNNLFRQSAHMATQGQATTRVCIVSSYDPNTYSAKVLVQPDNNETGWLPVTSTWIGNGWGMFCPPTPGDMVQVEFQEGGIDAGMIVGRFFNDSERPLSVPSGEFWLVHADGAFLKLTNDGKFSVNSQVEIDATAPTVNITATGNVAVSAANASVTATASASVTAPSISLGAAGQALKSFITDAFISLFNGHTHPVPGGTSSAPNQQMSAASHATSTVKGG